MPDTEIFCSHGDEYERSLLPPSFRQITLMMEAVSSSETSINIYQSTRHNIPENSHLHAGIVP
jgi:hypothetical protein